jgi:hypothetical protein
MKRIYSLLFVLWPILLSAQIYEYRNKEGERIFSDRPSTANLTAQPIKQSSQNQGWTPLISSTLSKGIKPEVNNNSTNEISNRNTPSIPGNVAKE